MRRLLIPVVLALAPACAHNAENHTRVAAAAIEDDIPPSRFQDGLMRLGASETRSACFAHVLAERLQRAGRAEAAGVLENANSRQDMRAGVMSATLEVRRAFIAANMRCPRTS
ncbi:MAG: hypothetical protein ACE5FO_12795 [Parvularculaceae bacterium]